MVFSLSPRSADFDLQLKSLDEKSSQTETYQTILAYEPWRSATVEKLGEALLEGGNAKEAVKVLEGASKKGWLSEKSYRILADAYEKNGQYEHALETWQKVLDSLPDERAIYMKVYQLQSQLGLEDEGLLTLEKLLIHFPDDAKGLYLSGLVYFSRNDERGVQNLKMASQKDAQFSQNVEILLDAASLTEKSDNQAYRGVIRGRSLSAVGAWPLAEKNFKQAVALDPTYAEGWAFLAEAKQQTDSGDGLSELQKAEELNPQSQVVKGLFALYWRRHSQFDQAVSLISQAAKQEPEQSSWQIEWANTLVEKGDLQEALLHFKEALELEPSNIENMKLLAEFCINYRFELRETGLPAARAAATRYPKDPSTHDLIGRAFSALGDFGSAERSYYRALQIDPKFAAAHLHLAQLYLEQGGLTQAYSYLKTAVTQNADGKTREIAARLLSRFYHEEIEINPN